MLSGQALPLSREVIQLLYHFHSSLLQQIQHLDPLKKVDVSLSHAVEEIQTTKSEIEAQGDSVANEIKRVPQDCLNLPGPLSQIWWSVSPPKQGTDSHPLSSVALSAESAFLLFHVPLS